MTKKIVVVGSVSLDFVAGANRIPIPGETIIGDSFQTFHGGKGGNQAVAAARLGHPVSMVGCVGDDAYGPQLVSGLARAGVNTEHFATAPGSSGVAIIFTGAGGQNSIIVVPGSNGKLTRKEFDRHIGALDGAGIILAQLEIPLETVEYLAETAEKKGIPLMLDPAPARELPASLFRKVSWITPNETETMILLNCKEEALAGREAEKAADELLSRGVGNVALKLGARGCLIATGGAKEFVPAYKVNAVDTTAAGDAFNGAFAVGLMRGLKARDSASYACAVAAISVTRAGAQPSMPAENEVQAFLREHGKN
jgi:ribokinase